MTAGSSRERSLDRVAGETVDLLVIGAGILGASTALAAASAGARVAVVDRGDLAGATSSASSKLLHGGLRYLEMGDVGQVLRSHSERWATARVMAPQLAAPTPFLVPVFLREMPWHPIEERPVRFSTTPSPGDFDYTQLAPSGYEIALCSKLCTPLVCASPNSWGCASRTSA